MTDIIELKNNAYRIIGRQISLWAWQSFELGCSFVLPWLVAGELAPAKPVEANLAATQRQLTETQLELRAAKAEQALVQQNVAQQVGVQPQAGVQVQVQVNNQNQNQNNVVVGAQNPGRWTRFKDFVYASGLFVAKAANFLIITLPVGAVRGAFRAINWVDASISRGLGFVDEALNKRFKSIPGYRLLTWYPFRLGNWEQTYKQTRNYVLLVNPVWQRFVQPFLKERIFSNEMAKAVTSYLAPYADEGLRLADKGVIGFLSTIYKSASDFGLEAFEKSFVGYWYGSAPVRTPVYNTFVTVSDFFTPVTVSTAQLEAAAERHIEHLKSAVPQVWGKITAMNGHVHYYAGHIMTLMATVANDVYRYGNCVANTDKGFMPCTQSAFSHAYADYAQPFMGYVFNHGLKPAGSFVYLNTVNPIMQFLLNNRVTGPMFYFGDCVANGNPGYSPLEPCKVLLDPIFENTCPMGSKVVSGFRECSGDALQYIQINYAQPGMGAIWNVVCDSGSAIGNFIWDDIVKASGTKMAQGAVFVATHPYTLPAVGGVVLFGFTALGIKTAYERVMKPGLQHVQVHGVNAVNNP